MSFAPRAALGGLLTLLLLAAPAAAPAAQGQSASAAPAAQGQSASLRLARLGAKATTVPAGGHLRVRSVVRSTRGRIVRAGRLTYSLRERRTGGRAIYLLGTTVRRTKARSSRRFPLRLRIPAATPAGRWYLRGCVRRGRARASCRAWRIAVTGRTPAPVDAPRAQPGTPPGPPEPPGPPPPAPREAQHSLRAPATGERFYFVMADRFENGSTANDHGGLAPEKMISGYDPTGKGWYHGGDLKGLRERIDYIQDLGTTAIWLTPSFKNKAVQPEDNSAGYHGYWITDFTQIDPHLGTNADLRALVDAAHARGMKVYFDIITNHTADVIEYAEGARTSYVSKDREPYRTAAGVPFDDREVAGSDAFPELDPVVSFPYTPTVPPEERDLKVPSWLNDVELYHNRGDTTFVGENAYYGDFFGLDDLFTEHPRVVQGMIDIYKTWITDFRIDGFRIDTMKHVDDAFWLRFAPEVLDHARSIGKDEFFMFGEVFDTTKRFTSHFTTQDRVQAVLDFPFQDAARGFAAASRPTDELRDFFVGDDWYTDADSNVYQLPTFLGNHDMGRIGHFIRSANGGASDAEVLARDRLAHDLMYLSRGNPVIFYGDEQGFVGDGGDQDARQDMFPSRVASYNDDDLIGTDATTAESNFDRAHPLFQHISRLAELTERHPALRDGAQQHRLSSGGPGVYAFSRLAREDQHEYVVALNNAETEQTAAVPTWAPDAAFLRVHGIGTRALRTDAGGRLTVTVPPLSAIVYRSSAPIPRSGGAPPITVGAADTDSDRLEVRADVGGTSFYEVTFLAKVGDGDWQAIGTDDNAPYRVFHDVAGLAPGTAVQYRAVVLDNAGATAGSGTDTATVAPPSIALEAPNDAGRVRGEVEVRAVATPDDPTDQVTFERRVGDGPWEAIGTDTSSPVYTAFDDTTGLADGATVHYRAVLTYAPGRTVVSDTRSVTVVSTPVTTLTIHYHRPLGDYLDWGVHFWGDATDDAIEPTWDDPWDRDGIDDFGAVFRIPITDDTKSLGFIVHRPSGDSVPTTREPGGDRHVVPLEHPEIWLKAGDATVYTSRPPLS